MPQRTEKIRQWARQELNLGDFTLEPASADASFRRYFRIRSGAMSWIVMDAPPDKEDVGPFIDVAEKFLRAGLHVPEILDRDPAQGFLLLTDLGNEPYLDLLDDSTVDRLYGDALGALLALQASGPVSGELPDYDRELLLAEMRLFPDWLLTRHLRWALDPQRVELLQSQFELLADSALEQPRVAVHRDYHSRNLMHVACNNPGIIDFQDAVIGPVTYDLVSLLRDCYIAWPRERVEAWALGYQELAVQAGVLRTEHEDPRRFLRWFDWMGVQRHLKAAGIFARLCHRDSKPGYLGDIPRTLGYVQEVAARYPELAPLGELVDEVLPVLATAARESGC